ncbi:MAG: MarR family winged helix-turn-helix transcriptional regulator [Acidimicrobiales bacterium]
MQVSNEPLGPDDAVVTDVLEDLQTVARWLTRSRVHERVLSDLGLRIDRPALLLLRKLQFAGGVDVRVTDLAHLLGVDLPGVTRKVQQLERAGLVVRAADERDRRVVLISLTPESGALLERAAAAYLRLLHEVLSDWPRDDVRRFAELFHAFSASLHNELERP